VNRQRNDLNTIHRRDAEAAERTQFSVLWFLVLSKVMQRFGEKLRTLRKQRGMTQHELAAQLGFASQGYIHFLETGKKLPNAHLILKIADFFEVTTDQLMRDELEVS
jgi:DNA-binding XRE family transcriptional regulator